MIIIIKGFQTIVFIFIVIVSHIVEITIKMKTIVQKPLMIITFYCILVCGQE